VTPLLRQFLTEAPELMQTISDELLQLERRPGDRELLDRLFRAMHSLKGNCGLFDLPELARVLDAGEDLMSALRDGEVGCTPALVDCLLEAVDFIHDLLEQIEVSGSSGLHNTARSAAVAAALRSIRPAVESKDPAPRRAETDSAMLAASIATVAPEWRLAWQQRQAAGEALWWLRYRPEPECFFKGEDPALLAQRTPSLQWHRVTLADPAVPLTQLDPYRCQLVFDLVSSASPAALEEHFRYVREQVDIAAIPPLEVDSDDSATDRYRAMADELMQAQIGVLENPDAAHTLAGTLKAVSATLDACLRSTGRSVLVPDLAAATSRAIAESSATPLQDWIRSQKACPVSTPTEKPAPAMSMAAATVRVPQDMLNRLMALTGELIVAENALPSLAERAQASDATLGRQIKTSHGSIHRIAQDLQDTMRQVRLMPLEVLLQSLPRLVRDLSRQLGKNVRLDIDAGGVAADKDVIEALMDPLVQLLRNSLDHGIELPERRLAAGKPIEGRVEIRAASTACRMVIDVIDDGHGIDLAALRRQARDQGMLSAQAAEQLSDAQALELVFAPGFTTAGAASPVSGRGVGMDVVRSMLAQLRGTVSLENRPGQGLRVRLSVPLSMAVNRVMIVESDAQVYGVPIDAVVETVRIARSQIFAIQDRQAASVRGRVVSLRSLNQLLRVDAPQRSNEYGEFSALVLSIDEDYVGLVVDEFREAANIVLNPLDGILCNLPGYAGTALRGDGSILMVLNPRELVA
jgi:two-component system chemotaxis sensor kinase CheA